MRVPLLLAVVATAALPAVPATASAPPTGAPCRMVTRSGWPAGATRRAVVTAGPVVAAGDAGVSVTCEIHDAGPFHAGPVVDAVDSAATPGVAVLDPRVVTVPAGTGPSLTICTSATVDGTRWYYTHTPAGGVWTTDPSGRCTHLTTAPGGGPDVLYPAFDYAVCRVALLLPVTVDPMPVQRSRSMCDSGPLLAELDETLCPALAAAAPGRDPVTIGPDGDVYVNGELWWDCPPYRPVA